MNLKTNQPFSVLFVCMGNICRSPTADNVLKHMAEEAGLGERLYVDSAGTIGFHAGNPPDSRMSAAARNRGLTLEGRARKVTRQDLDVFDRVIVMDEENRRDVLRRATTKAQRDRIVPFMRYCHEHNDPGVPDPYYGGPEGFEYVLDVVEDGCAQILEEARRELAKRR